MHVTNPHAETEQDSLYNFLSSVLQHPQDLSAGSDIVDFRFYLHRGDCYRSLSKLQPALADYHTALEMWTRNSTSMLTQRQGKNGDWPIRCRLGMVHHQIAMKLYNEVTKTLFPFSFPFLFPPLSLPFYPVCCFLTTLYFFIFFLNFIYFFFYPLHHSKFIQFGIL